MQWSVLGHTQQKNLLEEILKKGKLSGVYLLSGESGIGKKMFAHDVARHVLRTDSDIANNPDYMFLMTGISKDTGKITDISIDDALRLKRWAYQRPLYGLHKIAVIDDAEKLSDEAANALLKLLEETPPYVSVFLISSFPRAIISTILSRCFQIEFSLLADNDVREVLRAAHLQETDSQLVSSIALGRPGYALQCVRGDVMRDIMKASEELKLFCAQPIAERLLYTKQLADHERTGEIILWWLTLARKRMLEDAATAMLVRSLVSVVAHLSESKNNKRLALDAFALELPRISW